MQLNNPETLMRTRASRKIASTSALVERACKLLPGSLFLAASLGAGLSTMGAAYAADDATLNQCWGETTKQFAQVDDGKPGIGEHSSDPPGFEPGEGGRQGVAGVTKEIHGDLSEGGQGAHAIAVGGQMGLEPCDGPDVP